MLGRLFKARKPAATPQGVEALARVADDEHTPRYPPFAQGLPGTPIPTTLKTQEALVRDLRHSVGLAPELFDQVVWPVIECLAAWVHLLPASEAHHHRMTGGLLRHSLEVGLYAARMAEGTVFVPMATPMQRRAQEPRWHAAVAISGLLHDIGKPVSDVVVIDKAGNAWDAYTQSLHEWIQTNKVERYYIRWRPNRGRRHEQFAGLVADRLLPSATTSWLGEGGPELIEHVLSTITASVTATRFAKLVFDADHESVERDMRSNNAPSEPSLGVPVDRHILDAMRRLLADEAWQTNKAGARVWVLREGVFVVWERGCEDILDCLKRDRVPGIPRHPDALADALIERGHAQMRVVDEQTRYRYWLIQPKCIGTGSVVLKALQLATPDLLWPESEPPAPVPAWVGEQVETNNQSDNASEAQKTAPSKSKARPQTAKASSPGGVGRSQPTMPGEKPQSPSATYDDGADPQTAPAVGTRLTVTRAAASGEHVTPVTHDQGETVEEAPPSSNDDEGEALQARPPTEEATPAPTAEDAQAETGPSQTDAAPVEATERDTEQPEETPEVDDLEGLRSDCEAGRVLAEMVEAIREGTASVGSCFRKTQAGVLLIYPKPVRPYVDKPNKFLQALKARQWFEADPENPLRPVRKIDGVEGILLTRDLAQRLNGLVTIEPSPWKDSAMASSESSHTTDNQPPEATRQQTSPRRPRRRGPGKPSSSELTDNQANGAIERLIEAVQRTPSELPGELKPDRSKEGWLAVSLDAAVRFTGLSKTRMRLSLDTTSPVQIRQGYIYIPEAS